MSTLCNLAVKHWLVGGIAVSLLWFAAGRQSLLNRKPDTAIFWQSVAVVIGLTVCACAIMAKEWLGFFAAIVLVYFEVRSLRCSTLQPKANE